MKGVSQRLKVAMILTDEREERGRREEARPWFGSAPTALLEGLAGRDDCEVHVVSCVKRPVPDCPRLAVNIFHHSLVVRQWGWLRSGYSGCVLAVRRKLAELAVDLAHGHGSERYGALAAVGSGRPNLVTLHGNLRVLAALRRARPCSYLWVSARLEALAVRQAGGVVCISRHTERTVMGLARRVWQVPNAVDAASFAVHRQPVTPPVVLCVADLVPHKNQLGLLRALAPLAEQHRFTLRLAGRAGPDRYAEEVQSLVARCQWAEYVGLLDRAQLRAQLAGAAMVVLPSLEDNCPMAVLEALAAGVPVVAASVGGVPDLVEDGVTGWLSRPEDAAGWRARVAHLLAHPAAGETVAVVARRQALARFHPAVVAESHLGIYRELLAAHD